MGRSSVLAGREWCEWLESRTLMSAGAVRDAAPVGAIAPWLTPAVTVVPTEPPAATGRITAVVLVDAYTGQDLGPLANATLDNAANAYTVRADTEGDVASVRFMIEGQLWGLSTTAPFTPSLYRPDYTPRYSRWSGPIGEHTLDVVPYSSSGIAGTPFSVPSSAIGRPPPPLV